MSWLREQIRTMWAAGRFDSWGTWWEAEKAYLKVLGAILAGYGVLLLLVLWVLWTIQNQDLWIVWAVNMLTFGTLCWVGGGVWNDRSDSKHMRREHWCPKCGQDVAP